jgi:transposase
MSKHRKISRQKRKTNRSLIKFVKVLFLLFEIIGFPKHFSKFSNQIFNNWQLFALLVIRAKTKQSPEDLIEQILPGNIGLLNALGLEKIPTPSCLRKFARRLKAKWAHTALGGCAALAGLKDVFSGIDGTGHSKLKGSKHYYKRTGRKAKKKDYVKVVGLDDLMTQLVIAVRIRKKSRHDNVDFKPTVNRVARIVTLDTVIGDKGFDAQKNHEVAHKHGALLITPLKNKDVPIWRTSGVDRKKLKRYFPKKKYHKRSKKETVWSVVKQKFGDAVSSLTFHMQKIELLCKYLAYNIDRILTLQKKSKVMSSFSDELKITLMSD